MITLHHTKETIEAKIIELNEQLKTAPPRVTGQINASIRVWEDRLELRRKEEQYRLAVITRPNGEAPPEEEETLAEEEPSMSEPELEPETVPESHSRKRSKK